MKKRIILPGDSICHGYDAVVRADLADLADVACGRKVAICIRKHLSH